MELHETYKYLDREESDGIENCQMKDKLVREYYCWAWQILKTEQNSKNKKNDQKTRNLLTIKGIHYLKTDINRL